MDNRKAKISKALSVVAKHLNSLEVDWILGGSAALMVHGIDIYPNDLDVLVNPEDFEAVIENFSEITSSHSTNPSEFAVSGITVEIVKLRKRGDEEKVVFDGNVIPVNTLAEELSYYENREGKELMVTKIKEKLRS